MAEVMDGSAESKCDFSLLSIEETEQELILKLSALWDMTHLSEEWKKNLIYTLLQIMDLDSMNSFKDSWELHNVLPEAFGDLANFMWLKSTNFYELDQLVLGFFKENEDVILELKKLNEKLGVLAECQTTTGDFRNRGKFQIPLWDRFHDIWRTDFQDL
mgnify:CR=1 FL=1